MPSTWSEAGLARDLADRLEVGVPEHDAVADTRPVARRDPLDRAWVGVDAQQPTVGAGGLQDPEGVPSAADGRIDLEAARAR